MLFNLLVEILIGIELIVFVAMVLKLIRQKEISDIKNTKYFVPTVIINLLLYGIAIFHLQEHSNFFIAVIDTISCALSACFLQVEFDLVEPLMQSSYLFNVAFIFAYAITLFTLIFVLIGLLGRQFINFIKCKIKLFSKKEKLVILGDNADSRAFIKTIPASKTVFVWKPNPTKEEHKRLLTRKRLNVLFDAVSEKNFKRFQKSFTTFVSFLDDIQHIIGLIDVYKNINSDKFNLYIAIDSQYETTFKTGYENTSINFFNKQSIIAQKFVTDYPMTSFMRHGQINTDFGCVDENVSLNVFLIGYGSITKNIFKNMVIDNQFPCLTNGKFNHKQVQYYIFDKNGFTDQDFNYNSNRIFEAEFNDEYYPEPSKPMKYKFFKRDIFSEEFKYTLVGLLKQIPADNHLNYCILNFGEDLENIDFTYKLKRLFEENDINNTKFFTRITSAKFKSLVEKQENCFPYGEYDILNYDTIIAEKLNRLSIDRNFEKQLKYTEVLENYESIKTINSVSKQKLTLQNYKISLWNRLTAIKKDLFSYSSINIRTKLNLCGFDIVGEKEISNREFFEKYDNLKEIEFVNRQKVYHYPYPKSISVRNALAFQEQLHKNAFWLTNGYLPSEKAESIHLEKGEFYNLFPERREAAIITTFDGLDQVIADKMEYLEEKNIDKNSVENLDVKKALYMVMDNIPLYKYSNYIIYKK